MATPTSIRPAGDQLIVSFDDGSRAVAYPGVGGLWRIRAGTAGTDPGTGGSTGGTPAPGGGTTPVDAADDYPWPNGDPNVISPLGYAYVNCTDFVAWRMNRDVGVVSKPWTWTWGTMRITNGDAVGWRPDWQTHGWGVDIAPVAGCIAWHGLEYGDYGHVEYVRTVNKDGTVDCEGYNLRQYGEGKYYHRILATSDVASFLSAPH